MNRIEEQILQDGLNDPGHAEWMKRMDLQATVRGRMKVAIDGCECEQQEYHKILAQFIVNEIMHVGMISSRLRIYSPPFTVGYMMECGKMIVETYQNTEKGNLFYEILLKKETDFSQIVQENLYGEDIDPWHPFYRYHNIILQANLAVPFLKELVFYGCFTQIALMTTASDALGEITAHDLLSEKSQLVSFRTWSLNV